MTRRLLHILYSTSSVVVFVFCCDIRKYDEKQTVIPGCCLRFYLLLLRERRAGIVALLGWASFALF